MIVGSVGSKQPFVNTRRFAYNGALPRNRIEIDRTEEKVYFSRNGTPSIYSYPLTADLYYEGPAGPDKYCLSDEIYHEICQRGDSLLTTIVKDPDQSKYYGRIARKLNFPKERSYIGELTPTEMHDFSLLIKDTSKHLFADSFIIDPAAFDVDKRQFLVHGEENILDHSLFRLTPWANMEVWPIVNSLLFKGGNMSLCNGALWTLYPKLLPQGAVGLTTAIRN